MATIEIMLPPRFGEGNRAVDRLRRVTSHHNSIRGRPHQIRRLVGVGPPVHETIVATQQSEAGLDHRRGDQACH
jgi:hypothetical protein